MHENQQNTGLSQFPAFKVVSSTIHNKTCPREQAHHVCAVCRQRRGTRFGWLRCHDNYNNKLFHHKGACRLQGHPTTLFLLFTSGLLQRYHLSFSLCIHCQLSSCSPFLAASSIVTAILETSILGLQTSAVRPLPRRNTTSTHSFFYVNTTTICTSLSESLEDWNIFLAAKIVQLTSLKDGVTFTDGKQPALFTFSNRSSSLTGSRSNLCGSRRVLLHHPR